MTHSLTEKTIKIKVAFNLCSRRFKILSFFKKREKNSAVKKEYITFFKMSLMILFFICALGIITPVYGDYNEQF
ncbi:unknown protein [Simkania negevensis Z]|uniref:Uncharacterized protein n=1 Tax=Simkania negevensis (strain ATCC VR-1471 / DSM 27360 / Z) TaxID=331113 RepID=F8L390_SIMNZ|nr:unknown protein [Simkania negevensis Z]